MAHRRPLARVFPALVTTLVLAASCTDDPPKPADAPPAKPAAPEGLLVVGDQHSAGKAGWPTELGKLATAADDTLSLRLAIEPDGDASRFADAIAKAAPRPRVAVLALAVADDLTPAASGEKNKSRFAELLALKAEAKVPEALARTQGEIASAHQKCAELEVRCAVVLVPAPLQVDEKTHPAYAAKGYDVAGWMTGATPLMARLNGWLRTEKIPFVDPTPALKAAEEQAPFDRESLAMTPAGAKVMAEEVWRGLQVHAALGPVADTPSAPAAADAKPRKAREGATEEEQRLVKKLNGLKTIRSEMQAVLQELPARKKEAEELQADLKAIEGKLQPAIVAKVLAEAKAELDKRGAPEGSLLHRARGLDARLKPLMDKELADPKDPPEVAQLKKEVFKQQEATAALGAGTAVAFRALNVIEQMRIALPRLRKAAKRK